MQKHSNLTLIVYCSEMPNGEKIKAYQTFCRQIIFICDEENSPTLTEKFSIVSKVKEEGKVAALNAAIQKAKYAYILWMHDNETLPELLPKLHKDTFYAARISNGSGQTPIQNWQIRLIPNRNSVKPLLKGFEIPDIYSIAQQLEWQHSKQVFSISREEPLFPQKAIQKELDDGSESTMHTFWRGMMNTEEKKFTKAIQCFKKVLKRPILAPWNKLAALNSLANAYIETYKLYEACRTAKESLEISADQRAPHLTLYQYYNLKGNHKKAYGALKNYLQMADVSTKANWDVFLPKEQAVFLMAEISLYLGRHENAFKHYTQFCNYHNGNVSDSVLEKLLIYSIELGNRKKAIQYFKALFGPDLAEGLDKDQIVRVKEVLVLFADRNWYSFINKMYEQLVAQNPEDERLRNGWIRILMKNNEIQRAQALV